MEKLIGARGVLWRQNPQERIVVFATYHGDWIRFEDMFFMNTWSTTDARFFAFQEDWGNLTASDLNKMKPLAAGLK